MGRKGERCKVLARGKMNSCMVEFEDGYLAVTSRNALRRLAVQSDPPSTVDLDKKEGA